MKSTNPFAFDGPVEIVAHRGYSAKAPENTLIAMELAIDAGADAVEFDLHMASDGTPMLFHDKTLPRTTNGEGAVSARRPSELAELDAGSWFDAAFSGERIPTFAATLQKIGGRVGRIYAEVKGYGRPEELGGIVGIVADAGLADRTVFISMDWQALDRIRTTDPEALVGYIVETSSRASEGIERAAGDPRALLDFNAVVLLDDPSLAERSLGAGIRLATWTVDTVEQAEALLALGVPRLTTNEVGTLRAWKEQL